MGVDERSDAELVRRTLEGDENAFEALYERYRAHVYAYAYNRIGNPDDALTVVQDTFLKAYRNLRDLNDNAKFAGWIFRIASQLCIGTCRARRKQIVCISMSQISGEAEPLEIAALNEHRKIEKRIENLDLEEKALKAIAQLPGRMRSVMHLRMNGMRCKEIAQSLGITESAVKKRLSRARKKVKVLVREPETVNLRKPPNCKAPENSGRE